MKRKLSLAVKFLALYGFTFLVTYLVNRKYASHPSQAIYRTYAYMFITAGHFLTYLWVAFKKKAPGEARIVENRLNRKVPYGIFILVLSSIILLGILVVGLVTAK